MILFIELFRFRFENSRPIFSISYFSLWHLLFLFLHLLTDKIIFKFFLPISLNFQFQVSTYLF